MAIRVLHVLGGLNRGGVEAWLMQLLRHIDRDRFQIDFLVHTDEPAVFDDEVRGLGAEILPCLRPSQPRRYAARFREVLRGRRPYDVLHSHVAYFSGYVLKLGRDAGIPIRVAHSHTDRVWIESHAGWLRKGYIAWMRRMIRRHATHRFAVSSRAGHSLFGSHWAEDGDRNRVIYYGVDFSRFEVPPVRAEVRSEFGFEDQHFVIGHVGNFVPAKNHGFLLDIAAATIRLEPRARFLLVGDGKLRAAMQTRAAELGIAGKVVFTGSRGDVPRLMQGGMDAFVFPSNFEGLGLVAIEAQAAGLPCVLSDVVPREVDVLMDRLQRLSLDDSPETWARHLLAFQGYVRPEWQREGLRNLSQSPFAIDRATEVVESFYSLASSSAHRPV